MNIIFISELADKAFINYMKNQGTVILVPADARFDPRISSHPDLVISILDGTLVLDKLIHSSILQKLDAMEIPYVLGSSKLGDEYPADIAYNAVITGKHLIHKLNYTEPLILQHCRNTNKTLLHVNQGYTKCSTVVVDDNHLITGDRGIYEATRDYLEVLLVKPGNVTLEGYDYGFLGGCSGVINDTVVFHGDLSTHPDFLQIKEFLEGASKKLVYFRDFPLRDIGSILVYPLSSPPINPSLGRHVNIPIFVSHEGCPNDCVFCNQRKITAKAEAMTLQEVSRQIDTYCSTLEPGTFVELAFFGGSFTGIEARLQESYLKIALEYKKAGRIQAIRLSTRPDYITGEILDRLKYYEVDIIELGVQSLEEEVLTASKRGHLVADVYEAVRLIKSYGFSLGIQLMVGLPKDTKERAVQSAKLAAILQPDFARIYPTLVIRETELADLSTLGEYLPLTLEQAIDWTKEMYLVFLRAQIPVIRMGLQPTELIAEGKEVLYGPFHPAFRQLVESSCFYDMIIKQLEVQKELIKPTTDIIVLCNPKDISQVVGHNRRNLLQLKEAYPRLKIKPDFGIHPMKLEVLIQ